MGSVNNNIVYGGALEPEDIVTNGLTSIGQFALDRFRELGDKVILVDGLTGVEISAKKFEELIVQFARSLQNLGIKNDDVIGLCSENRLEFAVTMFGTLLLNATLAPFNVTYTERELEHAMSLSQPKVVFASGSVCEKVANVAHKTSFVKNVICFDKNVRVKNIKEFQNFLNNPKAKSAEPFQVGATNVNENVVIILCSSGTTGLPKGVQLSQLNILKTADSQFKSRIMLEDATILSVIPWFHAYGALTLMMISMLGAKMVFLPKFQDKHFLRCIQDYEVNACFMVPPLMVFLAKHPLVDEYDLSSLRALLCGAAPLSKETVDSVRQRLDIPIIRQGYGLSEATLSLLVQVDGHEKPGSVGCLRPGLYAKVIDPETGKALGCNERGELCFKGDTIMKGYIGDDKSTRGIIDDEGWLHTGDVGYYDEDLDFFIVDRIKELIKYKGFQVPPAEIEGLLLTNPNINDAAVIGIPDEACGELPMAFVVKKPNSNLTEKDVIDFVAKTASHAKRLHGGVRFIQEIPKNPTGKILRRVLRDMVKSGKSKL